jgi:curli biogenesis system outer membrane secretion channel CsgG
MNSRRFAASFAAIVLISSVALAGTQRKNASASVDSTPQAELKAGGKPRVFVSTSSGGNEGWTNDITRQSLEEALVNSGRFDVIAGTQRDNILREQGFANSDVVDPSQSAKVGRMLSAKYVISGTCQSVTTEKKSTGGFGGLAGRLGGRSPVNTNQDLGSKITAKIQIQMTDLESGKILLARSYEEKSSENPSFGTRSTDNAQEAAYRDIISRVAQQFVADVGGAAPIEAIVALVQGNRVALTAGSGSGVQPGMRFEVYADGDVIKNPATGEVLSVKTNRYAVIRVTEVEEKLAWAEIVKTYDDNGTEDASVVPSRIEQQMSVRALTGGGGGGGAESGGKKKKKDKEN